MMTREQINLRLRRLNHPEELRAGTLNQCAEKKFDAMLNILKENLSEDCTVRKVNACRADVTCLMWRQSNSFQIFYEMKNLLLARNYDLISESIIEETAAEPFQIALRYEGPMKIQSSAFCVQQGDALARQIAERLNMPLIHERIARLQPSEISILHEPNSDSTTIRVEMLRGSSTWSVFPPVFQWIPLKPRDCFDLTELMQLLYVSVSGAIKTS